jgi:hypothetical protein
MQVTIFIGKIADDNDSKSKKNRDIALGKDDS